MTEEEMGFMAVRGKTTARIVVVTTYILTKSLRSRSRNFMAVKKHNFRSTVLGRGFFASFKILMLAKGGQHEYNSNVDIFTIEGRSIFNIGK